MSYRNWPAIRKSLFPRKRRLGPVGHSVQLGLFALTLMVLVSINLSAAMPTASIQDDRRSRDDRRSEDDRRARDDRRAQDDGRPKDWRIEDLIEAATQDIDQFWRQTFAEKGWRYVPPKMVQPYTRPIRTPCGGASPNNAFYCARSNSIYYDIGFLDTQLTRDGDFAVVTILAHEWAHLIQQQLRSRGSLAIDRELQADSLAGVYARSAASRGLLDQGDLDEGMDNLYKSGDGRRVPWFHRNAHGAPRERVDAFLKGYKDGLEACLDN